jgi:hypothetical protein
MRSLLRPIILLAAALACPDHGRAEEEVEPSHSPEAEAGSVIIEAEPTPSEPTAEELLQRFRERLRTERNLAPIERPLAGGMVEVKTRYGRFCVPSANAFNTSALTGNFGLASFCAFY